MEKRSDHFISLESFKNLVSNVLQSVCTCRLEIFNRIFVLFCNQGVIGKESSFSTDLALINKGGGKIENTKTLSLQPTLSDNFKTDPKSLPTLDLV